MLAALLASARATTGAAASRSVAWWTRKPNIAVSLKLIEDQAPWDYAVAGEPTGLRVVRGVQRPVRLHVRVRGRAAHSSDPSQGRNAIVGMAPVLEAMQAFFDEEIGRYTCPGFTPATGSVGVIEGGSAPNIVPDECAVTLDIRTVLGQDNQETLTDLEAYVRERVPERDGLQVVFDPPGHDSPSFETAGDHPLVQTACALRGQAVAEVVLYGCDASKLAAAGIPSIIFGPGDIAQAHTGRVHCPNRSRGRHSRLHGSHVKTVTLKC